LALRACRELHGLCRRPRGHAAQFGGFCTRAASQNDTVGIDPGAWRVRDGRLSRHRSRAEQQGLECDIPERIAPLGQPARRPRPD
jgi:hypothetical protein